MEYNQYPFLEYLKILSCPRCKSSLKKKDDTLQCENSLCNSFYPIIDGKPILINEDNSIFPIADYLNVPQSPAWPKTKKRRRYRWLSTNVNGRRSLDKVSDLLYENSSLPIMLVIGAGSQGWGIQAISSGRKIIRIDTDVSMTANASIICDGHDLPFMDASIDGIIVQAVLEHVVDPQRCVKEMYRTLKDTGIVYSEIPFMQQVHMGRFDFTRFTHLGHRRLFRHFEEIESGLVAGPGTSLAWCCSYLLRCFTKSRLLTRLGTALFDGCKYIDYLVKDSPVALDAASCTYFLGRKSKEIISDRKLIAQYKGAQ